MKGSRATHAQPPSVLVHASRMGLMMEEIKTIVLTACSALILGEIIYFLTPSDKLVDCIYALVYTTVIVCSILSLTKTDFDFSLQFDAEPYKEEVDSYIQEVYLLETEEDLKKTIRDALDVVHIECSSIELLLSMDDEDVLSVDTLEVTLKYKSDIKNAETILTELFGGGIPFHIKADG